MISWRKTSKVFKIWRSFLDTPTMKLVRKRLDLLIANNNSQMLMYVLRNAAWRRKRKIQHVGTNALNYIERVK